MNESLKSAKWWRLGFVRMLAICGIIICIRWLLASVEAAGKFWDWSQLNGPASVLGLLAFVALFVLGFRSDVAMRDHERFSKFNRP